MLQRILLPAIFLFLAYGFWLSPNFKRVAAGVAIFLFGMLWLERGFKAFTGGTLERILAHTTDRLWKSLGFGAISATVMQSSSLVSLITISFLSAGLISLASGIGIVFGANLGTTTGAWLVAGFGLKIKLSAYAMPMLVFGIILVFQRSHSMRALGYVLAGLGLLFLGTHHMKEGFEAFRDSIDLSAFTVPGVAGVAVFVVIGALATAVTQSSHATLILILTALASEQVSYHDALALAIGTNIGTTVTALLGSLSSNVDGRRLAAAHLLFNVATAVLAVAFLRQLIVAVSWLSHPLGISPDDFTLQLAAFHSLFNLIGILVMLPAIPGLVRLLEWLFPSPLLSYKQPKYLNRASVDHPDAAIEAVRKETLRLYSHALTMIVSGLGLRKSEVLSTCDLEAALESSSRLIQPDIDGSYESNTKALYGAIVEFISLQRDGLSGDQIEEIHALRTAGQDVVESVKGVKHLQKNLCTHIASPDATLRSAYDGIRLRVARVLRELDRVRAAEDPTATLVTLDRVRVTLAEDDILANGMLDRLIRGGHIDAALATSLINDNSYAHDVCTSLIKMGQTLFGAHDVTRSSAERSVMLDDTEIREVAEARSD